MRSSHRRRRRRPPAVPAPPRRRARSTRGWLRRSTPFAATAPSPAARHTPPSARVIRVFTGRACAPPSPASAARCSAIRSASTWRGASSSTSTVRRPPVGSTATCSSSRCWRPRRPSRPSSRRTCAWRPSSAIERRPWSTGSRTTHTAIGTRSTCCRSQHACRRCTSCTRPWLRRHVRRAAKSSRPRSAGAPACRGSRRDTRRRRWDPCRRGSGRHADQLLRHGCALAGVGCAR